MKQWLSNKFKITCNRTCNKPSILEIHSIFDRSSVKMQLESNIYMYIYSSPKKTTRKIDHCVFSLMKKCVVWWSSMRYKMSSDSMYTCRLKQLSLASRNFCKFSLSKMYCQCRKWSYTVFFDDWYNFSLKQARFQRLQTRISYIYTLNNASTLELSKIALYRPCEILLAPSSSWDNGRSENIKNC